MNDNNNTFGEKVRFFRTNRHWTQDQLAEKADLSQAEVSKIEKGHFREPKEETIRKLARAFEIAPEMLVRGTLFAPLFGQSEILPFGSTYQGPPLTSYFASALTGLTDQRLKEIEALDQKVDDICRNYTAYPVVLYRPRLYTSPQTNPDVPSGQVYEIDQERVSTADLVILAAIFPSLGAGMELQLAYQSCSSVILLAKQGQPLSRMVLGCPAKKEVVEYRDFADLEIKMIQAMDRLLPLLAQYRFSIPQPQNELLDFELGQRIGQLRERRKLSQSDLARIVGVDVACIEALETKPEQFTNPSIKILRRVARALNISEAFIVTGHQVPIQYQNPLFNEHLTTLRAFAGDISMLSDDFEELWRNHVELYEHELSLPGAEKRTEIGDQKYWIRKHDELQREKAKGGKLF